MFRVRPSKIKLQADLHRARLLMESADGAETFSLQLSATQAQQLSLELKSLAFDRCGSHRLAHSAISALGARIDRLTLDEARPGWVGAYLELSNDQGTCQVPVDVVAGLAFAIHCSVPVYLSDRGTAALRDESADANGPAVPGAFQEAIESMDWPSEFE